MWLAKDLLDLKVFCFLEKFAKIKLGREQALT